ncbi:maleylacetoacetate isomerase [Polynucleobacter necessarius]|uniref:maleylacetoacetate isomerase n=1 Tax=Polynucleobacter necessarius TaxID=576610 RepID=UPI000E097C20|nr:maleylacetoacetate isomerase [Polynucleobacter necessarius]
MNLTERPKLYSFWRSSAAFRVRIALNLKGVDYEIIPIHLSKNGGDQFSEAYVNKNPNRLVPVFDDGKTCLHQSLAIIEYLEETQASPDLLPKSPAERAWVRAIAMDICSDIHPINNLRVLRYLIKELEVEVGSQAKDDWYQHWITLGLSSLEKQIGVHQKLGRFSFGDEPGLIEVCLVPQLFNALASKMDLKPYPTLVRILRECMNLPAFINASWENQIDAEGLNPVIPPQE